jgi:protein-S-isoprenylcysteine O-methyltransferase Ste14
MLTMYRWLLRLYPTNFYKEFAEEMISVFCQRRQDVRRQGLKIRALFLAREFRGMLTGALREQFTDDSFRRFDMRSFRFPRATIVVMVVTLFSVEIAIERARQISAGSDAGPHWLAISGVFGAMLVVMGILGMIGYVILRVLRQSGAQRLSSVETRPQQR